MNEKLRLFYALWPDDETRLSLKEWQNNLIGRKTRIENLHITLAFLGDQSKDRLKCLIDILQTLSATAFDIKLDRFGYFSKTQIAWAGPAKKNERLLALQAQLVRKLRDKSIVFDDKNRFVPHITLARKATPLEDTKRQPIIWKVKRMVLVHSQMVETPQGRSVKYATIADRFLI